MIFRNVTEPNKIMIAPSSHKGPALMKCIVIYYSLTGTTRTIAQRIAAALDADLTEIRCTRYRARPLDYIRAAIDSVINHPSDAIFTHRPLGEYDLLIIGGPMWMRHIAVPVRQYLRINHLRAHRVAFFLAHAGSPPGTAFREMEKLIGKAPISALAVRNGDQTHMNTDAAFTAFSASLRAAVRASQVDIMQSEA